MNASNIKVPPMPAPWITDHSATDPTARYHYAQDQLAARDSQWLEMYGPVVEAAQKLMAMRVGELPNLGYLPDNVKSREALGEMKAALSNITKA